MEALAPYLPYVAIGLLALVALRFLAGLVRIVIVGGGIVLALLLVMGQM